MSLKMAVQKVYSSGRERGQVLVNGRPLSPEASQKIYNHSPDGFNWGYGGSGPAQLALAILLDVFGAGAEELKFYQDFKFRVIANLPMDPWQFNDTEVREMMADIMRGRAA